MVTSRLTVRCVKPCLQLGREFPRLIPIEGAQPVLKWGGHEVPGLRPFLEPPPDIPLSIGAKRLSGQAEHRAASWSIADTTPRNTRFIAAISTV
jgi:hypothetical protein